MKYLITKANYYIIDSSNKAIEIDTAETGDIIVLQEKSGSYEEILLTLTSTAP
jgi:hypothetical protein